MAAILIIEDEKGIIFALEDRLTAEGYSVDTAEDGITGQEKAETGLFDCIILDLMLPGRDGYKVCENLRRQEINTPILMLTARNTNLDEIMGLRTGADDYLGKPFDTAVLLARIEALLRRNSTQKTHKNVKPGNYSFGDFVLDTSEKTLSQKGKPIPLNLREYKLLLYFIENPNRILSRDELLNAVWGYDAVTSTRTVDVHVAWLRQKLGESDDPSFLYTVRGFGYKFLD